MCNFKPLACGFHSHTAEGSLDGASTVSQKIIHAAQQGRIADCVTDHGLMSALAPHWMASKKLLKEGKIDKPIKSIHGIELYVIDPHRPAKIVKDTKTKEDKEIPEYYHLTIHFKDSVAYKYFCELTPIMENRGILKWGELKPLATFEEIEKITGHITIGSGCLLGPVQKNVLRGRMDLAEKMYLKLREMAGPGNFFVEAFPHCVNKNWKRPVVDKKNKKLIEPGKFEPIKEVWGWEGKEENHPKIDECTGSIDIQKEPNMFVILMAKKYNDPVVISLDDHFAKPEDEIVQRVRLGNGQENWRFSNSYAAYDSEYCVSELKKQLGNDLITDKFAEEMIDNSYMFVDKFNDYKMETSDDRWLLPSLEMFSGNTSKSSIDIFWEKAKIHKRLPDKDDPNYQTYMDRINYELDVLAKNPVADFLPYFFVYEKIANWGRETGNFINVRGSAGGSLVLYALGVSFSDPIKYKLPFERFLTLGRIASGSLPDVDLDCENRDAVIDYLYQEFGDRVCLISTNLYLRLKMSIKDCERAILGYVRDSTESLTKDLKIPVGMDDKDWLFGYTDRKTDIYTPGFMENDIDPVAQRLREYAENNKEIWESVVKCIGIPKSKGIHAGGIIIAPDSAYKYFPMTKTSGGRSILATSYDMKAVEMVGGVKLDILTVESLKGQSVAIDSIKENLGIDIERKAMPFSQEAIDHVISKNLLQGIFQISTSTMAPYVKQIMPRSIEQLSALIALVRPGSLDAPSPDPSDGHQETAATYYISCSRGVRSPYYIHEDLKPILEETFGMILYQEQPLEIFRTFAGYSYEEAEEVRRGIGKKDEKVLVKHGKILVDCLREKGWSKDQADRLFDSIIASARYSFNKAHSISYAIVAYNCIYFKYFYPVHYWKGMLMINIDKRKRLQEMLEEARDYLKDVDILRSDATKWKVFDEKELVPPYNLIKGCGEKGSIALREYLNNYPEISSSDDLCAAIRRDKAEKKNMGLSISVMTNLLFSGAMDNIIDFKGSKPNDKYKVYKEEHEKLRKSLKSTASLGKKKKGEYLGLEDITSATALSFWQFQTNPFSSFDFVNLYKNGLKYRGFLPHDSGSIFPMKKIAPKEPGLWLLNEWSTLFEYRDSDFFRSMLRGLNKICLLGVITEAKLVPYANGSKDRIIFQLYNGYENIVDLVMFPKKGENHVSEYIKHTMTSSKLVFMTVKPSIWGDKKSGIVESIDEIFLYGTEDE